MSKFSSVENRVEAGGEYGGQVLTVEPHGIEQVSASERHGRPRALFTLWLSANATIVLAATVLKSETVIEADSSLEEEVAPCPQEASEMTQQGGLSGVTGREGDDQPAAFSEMSGDSRTTQCKSRR